MAHCVQIPPSDLKRSEPKCTMRFWLVFNKELNSHWSTLVPFPQSFALVCSAKKVGRRSRNISHVKHFVSLRLFITHRNHRTNSPMPFFLMLSHGFLKTCRALCTNWHHFINYPSTAPSVRHLQPLHFICHPVYAYPQYAKYCISDRTLFNTDWASITVYYTRQGQSKEAQ